MWLWEMYEFITLPHRFPSLIESTQTAGREISSELSELDEPKPKHKAKAVSKVWSQQPCLYRF